MEMHFLIRQVKLFLHDQFMYAWMNGPYPQDETGCNVNSLPLFYLYSKNTCHLNKRGIEVALL